MLYPAYCRPLAFDALAEELPRLTSCRGLVRAACAIAAHDQLTFQATQTEAALDRIIETVDRRASSGNPNALLAHLHDVLFDVLQFAGNSDNYYTPDNSYLPQVVTSRRGIPITLVLVYKYVATGLGLNVQGVNAPGHFLAAVETIEGTQSSLMFVDPFYGGKLLSLSETFTRIAQTTGRPIEPDPRLLAPASHREWLLRMLRNLQALFARSGREKDLYAMQEMQTLLKGEEE